ncbi:MULTISPECIES: ATP-binding protein [Microbacterium]|nr:MULTISPECIES: ATP-binding protein [Microbacterium]
MGRMTPAAAPDAARTAPAPRPVPPARPPLVRPRECVVAGVAEGLAHHLGAPVSAVRALLVVLALCGGAGILFYAWCWAFAPRAAGDAPTTSSAPIAWILTCGAAIILLPLTALAVVGSRASSDLAAVVGAASAAAAAAGAWATLVDRRDPLRGPGHAVIVRTAAVIILLAVFGVTILALRDGVAADALLIVVPLIALAAVLSSTLVEKWRELTGERDRRIREEQRAEMAAHLHDSVLQTLALIQNRGGASSDVARLARAQERELRAWLYDGDQPADSDLATDLRDYAAALELDYPVRIDVVAAGISNERASGEIAAAAREAMLNAARHAGGDVSVYIEGRADGVDVFVRDRGPGFVLDDVADDRLGVRQSVIGRMRRLGGTATVTSGPEGTEVQLRATTAEGNARG